MTRRSFWLAVLASLAVVLVVRSAFVVDQTEAVIHLRFGQHVRTLDAPGLFFKWPTDSVVRLDRRLQVLQSPPGAAAPREYLTGDATGIGKNVVATTATYWRIDTTHDAALRFFETMGDLDTARARLDDIVVSEFGATLGRTPLGDLVSTDSDAPTWDTFLDGVRERCAARVNEAYGIALVDVRIEHLSFPERNRVNVFERMRAERETIAARQRSEGEREATTIRARSERQRDEILAAAHEEAAQILGGAEAQAARTYAEAYGRDPVFYEFVRTLEAYEKTLDEGTVAVLSSESGFLELLREALGGDADTTTAAPPATDATKNE